MASDARQPSPASPRSERETSLAALAYLLTWLSGLIVFVLADEEETFARWHSIQAIGLGLALALASTAVGVVGALVALVLMLTGGAHGFGSPSLVGGTIIGTAGLSFLLPLVLLVVVVVLAVKAYRGQTPRIPVIAGFADDIA